MHRDTSTSSGGKSANRSGLPPGSAARIRSAAWVVCVGLALGVVVAFGRCVQFGFVSLDDEHYICANSHVLHGLAPAEVGWAFSNLEANFWLPLVWLSYMLDNQLYGTWAGGWHATNVLLHAAAAAVLFLALRQLTGRHWPSALTAALFAVHPLRAESVAWVTERKDVLSGLLFALTLWAYAEYARRPFALGRYSLLLLCFLLALMCKPMVVSLPLVLLLLDFWPLGRWASSAKPGFPVLARLVAEKLPMLLASAACCAVTIVAARGTIESAPSPLVVRLGKAVLAYVVYLGEMLWPVGLSPVYPDTGDAPGVAAVVLSAVVCVALTAAAIRVWPRYPFVLVGWLWYVVMLFPVSGIVEQGAELRPDRFTYLPQIGLALIFAWGVAELERAVPSVRRPLRCAVACLLAVLLGATAWQCGFWRDNQSLWTRSLAISPRNGLALTQVGMLRERGGRPDEAIALLEQVVRYQPRKPEAYYNLAQALAQNHRAADAAAMYGRALQFRPDYAEAHNNLGVLLAQAGDLSGAIEHYRRAVAARPAYAEACNNLGNALARAGRFAEAVAWYQQAIRYKDDLADAYCNCGTALLRLERLPEAIDSYRQAVRLKPDDVLALRSLGLCLARTGRGSEALACLEQALQAARRAGQPALVAAIRNDMQRLQEPRERSRVP